MKRFVYRQIEGRGGNYVTLLFWLFLFVAAGLGAAWYVDYHGHRVTGMTNQVVWTLPHVVSVFLILAAAGSFNVVTISRLFGRRAYWPLARLSGLLAVALLAGGLFVLVLDLGRPDRLWVAMSHFNFKSTLASNIFRYTGFVVAIGVFLWTVMEPRMNRYSRAACLVGFLFGISLSTGVGLEFGFLAAREAFDSALLAPMFVSLSLVLGLAVFILVLTACHVWSRRPLGKTVVRRLGNLLGVLVGVVLYFTVVHHLTTPYAAEHQGIERFILLEGGLYTALFWVGQVALGGLVPLFLIYYPGTAGSLGAVVVSALLVVIGGLAQLYVLIIGGQAYPMVLFPGMVEASVSDGHINAYAPSLPEAALGAGGVALALAIVAVAVKVLPLLPESLADEPAE